MHEFTARMDDMGRPAWLALMVLGFIFFWPIGLLVLAYLLWSGRMGCNWHDARDWRQRAAERFERKRERWERKMERFAGYGRPGMGGRSGNRAFDEYREATLRRLEEEQQAFHDFLSRLRMAKDREEFDAFMADRRTQGAQNNPPAEPRGPSSGPSGPSVPQA
jgi:hypothetical protein